MSERRSFGTLIWRPRHWFWILSVTVLVATGLSYGCDRECRSINDVAQARFALKPILVQTQESFPNSFKIVDLDNQITEVKVNGPQMSYDTVDMRYVRFKLDTRCGATVELNAMFNGCGDLLNLTPIWVDCANGGRDSRLPKQY